MVTQFNNKLGHFIIENGAGKMYQNQHSVVAFIPRDQNTKTQIDMRVFHGILNDKDDTGLLLKNFLGKITMEDILSKINAEEILLSDLN